MQPEVQDVKLYEGDTFEFFFRIRERVYDVATDSYIAGDYVDLTNHTFKSEIRPTAGNATLITSFTVTKSDQTDVSTRGGVLVTLSAAVSATAVAAIDALSTKTAKWDIQSTDATGRVATYFKGDVTIERQVTV